MSTEPNADFEYIRDQQELKKILKPLKAAPKIALDTEADSFHHYYPKVCLIQLSTADRHFIVDPLADLMIDPLLEILAEKPLVIHDAGYDLRMLKADFDFTPGKAVFDTMLAGRLLGYEKVGLASMIEQFFSVHVPKTNQRADWSKRPLPDHLLHYAIEDTRYLLELAQILEKQLNEKDRLSWHVQSCSQAVTAALEAEREPESPDDWRIKGSSKLTRRQAAFLRDLWRWRQQQARRADLPPFRILHNSQLLDLAQWAAGRKDPVRSPLPKLPRNCKGTRLAQIKKAIHKAAALPEDQWPSPKKAPSGQKPDPLHVRQAEAIRKKCQQVADSLQLPVQEIIARAALGTIVRHQLTTVEQMIRHNLLMPWQAELIEPIVQQVLQNGEDTLK